MVRNVLLVGNPDWRKGVKAALASHEYAPTPTPGEVGTLEVSTVNEAQRVLRRKVVYVVIVEPVTVYVRFAEKLLPLLNLPGGKLDRVLCYDDHIGYSDLSAFQVVITDDPRTLVGMVIETMADAESYENRNDEYGELPPHQ